MASGPKYTFGEGVRDFLTTISHIGTCIVSYVIAKDQPALAGIVFIVGTVGTRGVRKEIQARLLKMASDKVKSIEAKIGKGDGDE